MRFFTFCAVMLFTAFSFAQDNVKGYYITASGQKTEGYFMPADFNDTPSLKFSTSEYDNYNGLPQEVVEYGIYEDDLKFEKYTVDIDISGNEGFQKEPSWSKQTVFLYVMVEGNASLYSYTKNYKTQFFFSTKNKAGVVSQLVYKKYKLLDGNNTVVENAGFKQQLYNAVKCEGQNVSDFAQLRYDNKQLSDAFKKYNECSGSKSKAYGPKKKSSFKYNAFVGIHNLTTGIEAAFPAVDDQSTITYSFGGEVVFTFPKEKFSLFFRVEYESLTSEVKDSHDQGYNVLTSTYKIDAYALNFMFGPRYNFLTLKNHELFLDAGVCLSTPFGDIKKTTLITPPAGSGDPYSGDHNEHKLKTGFGLNLGLGYTFNKKYGIAVRYITNRDYLEDVYSSFKTKISRVGVVFSYTLN